MRDASLKVFESGAGEPVVLVHGSVSDLRTWSDVQAELSQQFRVISYSRRYHWPNQSIARGADYSMVEHVDDLEALLLDLGSPAHLVGHSYGAYLALMLVVRNPALARTLVLAEPPLLPLFVSLPPSPREMFRLLRRRPKVAAAIARFGATGFSPAVKAIQRGARDEAVVTFGSAVLGEDAFNALSEERMEQVRANVIDAEFVGSGFVPIQDADIAAVGKPTLLVGAENSPPLFRYILDRLEELIPGADRTTIPAASHIMHEDNLESFVAAVRRFFR